MHRYLIAATALLLATAACGSATSNSSTSSNSSPSASGGTVVAKLKTATIGGKSESILSDANGMTLYYFTPDSATKVACTGQCAALWPALTLASGTPSAADTMSGSLTTLNGPNGRQVLYNGHPLYRYASDKTTSDVKGQGLFGKWFAATPTLASNSGASSSSGYGY